MSSSPADSLSAPSSNSSTLPRSSTSPTSTSASPSSIFSSSSTLSSSSNSVAFTASANTSTSLPSSSHSRPSHYSQSTTGIPLVPADQKDLYAGNAIFVRGQPATVTHVDFPHVHWRTADMEADTEKHRSFSATPHIFSVDPSKRGSIPHGPAAGASPSLAASFKPVPALRVGANPDEEDDDDEDDDDDDDFSEQAVTAVLKPEQASRALQHLQERRSPKHSPKHRKGGGGGAEGDAAPPADSDS